jgi:hypothetical protein
MSPYSAISLYKKVLLLTFKLRSVETILLHQNVDEEQFLVQPLGMHPTTSVVDERELQKPPT